MRDILFRGRMPDGEWVSGYYTAIPNANLKIEHLIFNLLALQAYLVIPETVGQYTGLTDKNGTKIFEGDIVPILEQGEEYPYKVIYNADCFMLAMLGSEQGSYPLSVKHAQTEVIGNIHDNPELIGGANDE